MDKYEFKRLNNEIQMYQRLLKEPAFGEATRDLLQLEITKRQRVIDKALKNGSGVIS